MMDIKIIICIFRRIYVDDFNRAIVIHVPFFVVKILYQQIKRSEHNSKSRTKIIQAYKYHSNINALKHRSEIQARKKDNG